MIKIDDNKKEKFFSLMKQESEMISLISTIFSICLAILF